MSGLLEAESIEIEPESRMCGFVWFDGGWGEQETKSLGYRTCSQLYILAMRLKFNSQLDGSGIGFFTCPGIADFIILIMEPLNGE